MEISDELVEKAAQALLDANVLREPVGHTKTFMLHRARASARRGLEAVAPAIRAAAMEEAAQIADERKTRAEEKFDGVVKRARFGERNLELAAAHEARAIAAAIRAAKGGE
jgi:hypothetical protein